MYLLLSVFENIYRMEREPDYEPAPQKSVAAMAKARGISPAEMAYELLLEDEGLAILFVPFSNFADHNLDTALEMMRSEEHTSELQSLMRISYAVFCLKKNNTTTTT